MKHDNTHFGAEARDGLIRGIRKCAIAVGGTMGTGGSNALIEAIENPGHMTTNDGATILGAIKFADPLEEMGRKILLEAVSRANKQSGDGSSTTTVLCAAILEEGLKHLNEAHPMEIKRALEECIPLIETALEQQRREVTVNDIKSVAAISAEDEQIGQTIEDIYKEIGPKGIIYWDISKTAEDSYKIGKGITVEGAGYVSPYMCDMAEGGGGFTNVARIQNPVILLTREKVTSAIDFEKLVVDLNNEGKKELVIFCDEADPLAITQFVQTRIVRGFRTTIVKMPILWRDWWYEDLAKATGATVLDQGKGLTLKSAKREHLGTVSNMVITKEDTYLDGIQDVSEWVGELEAKADDDSMIRAARLSTRTARYYVGALSDSALSYRRLKVEDAISASWQALNGGIVAGGGASLLNVSALMPTTVGGKILKRALEEPARCIYANAGMRVPDMFLYSGTDKGGVDTRQRKEVGDMFEAGIVDPLKVVFNACKNAISVAASVLTINVTIELPRDDEQLQTIRPM